MRFIIPRRRQPPAVIIVALIDILIVLLIFLMVTSTFRQQPALKLALPESSQALKTGATEKPPVVVTIAPNGGLYLDQTPISMERLKSELTARAASNPKLQLAISADKTAPFGQIIKVMDAAKETGIKAVNAYTKTTAK